MEGFRKRLFSAILGGGETPLHKALGPYSLYRVGASMLGTWKVWWFYSVPLA